MDAAAGDSWSARLSTATRRHQPRSDPFLGVEEFFDGDEESRPEYLCPFCAEDFDIVGLCCHIDEEHPVEARNGVCPVCARRVGMDMVGHITTQHGNFFKVQRKRRFRKVGSNSTFSILRKELREGNLPSFLGGPSRMVSSSNTEPDPLLSSFIFNPRMVGEPVSSQPHSTVEPTLVKESSEDEFLERKGQQGVVTDKEQEEKARRCEFVGGLMLSTILDDGL
ncbi:protein DEHYDRATION-INDUCED 19 homolog 4-like [Malania oleifera]|uniref:protein DEHYDRATION-INDUCED 19 homolog 4-like n=1 Tax=Malania oleifera TaxID=397392 RepID=UPI0025AEAE72|nr:protein DEHYDRATION-INDUCED 19 homolog 4-like [Malania oleifera]